jgi:cell division septum initiation protein DivIVA
MTKNEEIKILKEAADKLGHDSYLGPWLVSIMAELSMMIQSDLLPSISLKGAVEGAESLRKNILEEASYKANKILHDATTKAKKMEDDAKSLQMRVACAIHNAKNEIERW